MVAENNPNLWLLQTAAAKLEPLLDEIAFLGGCATGLLITDTATAPVRSTVDVDVIARCFRGSASPNVCGARELISPKILKCILHNRLQSGDFGILQRRKFALASLLP